MRRAIPLITAFLMTGLTLVFMTWINRVNVKLADRQESKTNFAQIETEPKEERVPPKPAPPKPEQAAPDLAPDLSQLLAGSHFGLEGFQVDLSALSDSIIGDASNVSMTEETVDVAPVPKERPPLIFPERARKLGVSGYVQLSLFIDKSGRVHQAKVLESEPPGVFEQSALSAVKQWSFEPALYQGNAVSLWVKQKISFNLN